MRVALALVLVALSALPGAAQTTIRAQDPTTLAPVMFGDATALAARVVQATATECVVLSAASTNSTNCKATAGTWYGYDLINTTTTIYYLRLYNTAGAPTCSSATGFIRSIPIPPASSAGGAGGAIRIAAVPVAYATGIGYCLTGGSSSTDNTNAATGVFGALLYR